MSLSIIYLVEKCIVAGEGGEGGEDDEGGVGERAGRKGPARDRLGRRLQLPGHVCSRHDTYTNKYEINMIYESRLSNLRENPNNIG